MVRLIIQRSSDKGFSVEFILFEEKKRTKAENLNVQRNSCPSKHNYLCPPSPSLSPLFLFLSFSFFDCLSKRSNISLKSRQKVAVSCSLSSSLSLLSLLPSLATRFSLSFHSLIHPCCFIPPSPRTNRQKRAACR